MRFVIMAYANGAYEEFRLPALNDADHEILLSAVRFGLKKDIALRFEVLSGEWKVLGGKGYALFDRQEQKEQLPLADELTFGVISGADHVTLIVTGEAESLPCFQKIDISRLRELTVGKQEGCHIRYDFRGLVSKRHAVLAREADGSMRLTDQSTNGVYVNGQRIQGARRLAFGDVINILGLKLVFLGDALGVYALGRQVEIDPRIHMPYVLPQSGEKQPPAEESRFKRAPRAVEELHREPVEIEAPPPPNKPKKQPLLLTIGPAFTMMIPMLLGSGMAIFSAGATGMGRSPFMFTGIITAVSSAAIGVMWALINMRHAKKQLREDELHRFNAYRDYLVRIADELNEQYRDNAKTLNDRYPSAEACLRYGADPTRLWNRNFTHDDLLFVRLGMGSMPFQVPIGIPKERFTLVDDSLSEKPKQIFDSFSTLRDVPVGVDLGADPLWGIYGGGSMAEGISVARSMAVQLAANTCYTDVKLVFLYEKQYEREFAFAKWLPHVWSEDKKVRYVASDKNEVSDVLYALGSTLRIRAEQENRRGAARPHYVVFVCDPDLLEGEPAAKYLLEPVEGLGVSTVLIAPGYEALPNSCTNLIERDKHFCGFYDVSTVESKKRAVAFDDVSAFEAERFARWLSGIRVKELESGGELADAVTFFDLYGVQSLAEFGVIDRWRKNRTYENMRALVGQKAGGADLYLDIHEKYHGPHGLVAGTTGSGKSETLQTYMLSLALNFSPLDVGFFVIDYKGGGMANLFSDLPHMLGQISNLSGNQVRRAMVSIKSEIKRRQRIFGEYDVNHLDQYTRLLKNGEAAVPIPHMVIVIDEFAELKREEPDFMRELISVAQVGRSLGIHLILATQKPAGTVDDNIWSNSKFKLCLRVQDKQDSMDMLKKPDAAYITRAGRCYLQVGNDEIFELFQSGWSGAAYDEDMAAAKAEVATMLSKTGQPSLVGNRSKLKWKEQKRLGWFREIYDCILAAAKAENKSLDAILKDAHDKDAAVEAVFAMLANKGYEYPVSRYNAKRLEDFMLLAAKAQGVGDKAKTLDIIRKTAALGGIKLPELKEKTQLAAVVEYLKEQAEKSGMKADLTLWLPVLPARLHLAELQGFAGGAFRNGWQPVLPGRE
ncbi:MAG: FHA domain-containing protein [Clostridia bacterium]|nr:FHA domain-containing protein [Clostridia bacterium]